MAFTYGPQADIPVGGLDAFATIPSPATTAEVSAPFWLSPWGLRTSNNFNQTSILPYKAISYVPVRVDVTSTYDRIGIGLISTYGGTDTWTFRLGLYDDNDGYPGTRLADYGTLTVSSATSTGNKLITIDQELEGEKLYWLAIAQTTNAAGGPVYGASPALGNITGDFKNYRKLYYSPASSATCGICWQEQMFSSDGTLPSAAASDWTATAGVGGRVPQIGLRRA